MGERGGASPGPADRVSPPLDIRLRRRVSGENVEEPPTDLAELRDWIADHPGAEWFAAVPGSSADLRWPAPGEPWPYP